jgi:NAD+ diphosphatase
MLLDSSHLPFNRESLEGRYLPAHQNGLTPPAEGHGYWLLVQEQALLLGDGDGAGGLPHGTLPAELEGKTTDTVYLGTYLGEPCWAASVGPEVPLPPGYRNESVVPQRTNLADDLLSLGGLALQATGWEAASRHCPRCGERTTGISGERGKRCPRCSYEHYPHLHPAIIVLVRDEDRVLLTRKSFWVKGRYGLVAGFVDVGESLEGAVQREIKEEVGVEVCDIRYIASQYWPFPSQLMIGFTARYAGGEVRVDTKEIEDARWFSIHDLPNLPPRLSIARFILDHYAQPEGTSTA